MQVSITLKSNSKISLRYVVKLFLKPSNVLAFLTLSGSLFELYTNLLKYNFLDCSFLHRGIGKFDDSDCVVHLLSFIKYIPSGGNEQGS